MQPEDPYFVKVFERGNHYHLLHSLLLALAPVARYEQWQPLEWELHAPVLTV